MTGNILRGVFTLAHVEPEITEEEGFMTQTEAHHPGDDQQVLASLLESSHVFHLSYSLHLGLTPPWGKFIYTVSTCVCAFVLLDKCPLTCSILLGKATVQQIKQSTVAVLENHGSHFHNVFTMNSSFTPVYVLVSAIHIHVWTLSLTLTTAALFSNSWQHQFLLQLSPPSRPPSDAAFWAND